MRGSSVSPDPSKRLYVSTYRLTAAELATVRSAAEAAGVSIADYARQKLVKKPPRSTRKRHRADAAELAAILAQLGKIGSNLNQLARLANQGHFPAVAVLRPALDDLGVMRAALLEVLQ